MMLEKTIERRVVTLAIAAGWLAFKWVSPSQRSVPDRIFIRDGEVVFIEFKAPGKTATVSQQRMIEKLRDHGMTAHVCNSVEGGRYALSI